MGREEDTTSKWNMRKNIISLMLQTRAAMGSMVRSYSAIGVRRYVRCDYYSSAALLNIWNSDHDLVSHTTANSFEPRSIHFNVSVHLDLLSASPANVFALHCNGFAGVFFVWHCIATQIARHDVMSRTTAYFIEPRSIDFNLGMPCIVCDSRSSIDFTRW